MPTFSKFIEGQRASQQLVDTDGYIYSRKKPKDTARPLLCLAMPEKNPSLLPSVPIMPTSLCQIIPNPLGPKPTTTLLTMLLHRNVKSSLISSGKLLYIPEPTGLQTERFTLPRMYSPRVTLFMLLLTRNVCRWFIFL